MTVDDGTLAQVDETARHADVVRVGRAAEGVDATAEQPGAVQGALLPAQLHPEQFDGPWAMQLAVRYEKAALPSHAAVCAAAARAVVALLADERARGVGDWVPAVRRWRDGRIRKLVRRARGVAWDRVQDLPGVTVAEGGAQVRAFVPLPARPLPPLLDQLQVSGTTFPRRPSAACQTDETDVPRVASDEGPAGPVATVVLNPHVDLTTGKAAAQAGHAAQLLWEHLVQAGASEELKRWSRTGWRVVVIDDPTPGDWAAVKSAPVRVVDAGFTEVDGPTETARAWWSPENGPSSRPARARSPRHHEAERRRR